MKVTIAFPPLPKMKGIPLLTQNRQFQWFSNPTFIYPMIPASAATLLKEDGFQVEFIDAIAQGWTYQEFTNHLQESKPDLVAFETKTPVIEQQWQIIDHLKSICPQTKSVLMGDHVSALPEESLEKSRVDYVITGGDFDVSLLQLANHLRDNAPKPKGIWYRAQSTAGNTGAFEPIRNLDALPFIDRDKTNWTLYCENWHKRKPFMYMMAGRDCWWRFNGGCTFCSWASLYPEYRVRSPEKHLDEIEQLIQKHRVREIFDDTGTFPSGKWLEKFCEGMVTRGYSEEILFSCNFRYDQVSRDVCKRMKKAGFRLLKVGLESACQETLDRINKGVKVQQIVDGSKIAKKAGLEIHLTIMVGYPWETKDDTLRTLTLAKTLMDQGLADVLQSTVLIPYPGTQLYKQAVELNWFRINPNDYERYDMTEPVLKTPDLAPEEIMEMCDEIYQVYLSPKYVLRRFFKSMLSWDDFKLSIRGMKAAMSHINDFSTTRR